MHLLRLPATLATAALGLTLAACGGDSAAGPTLVVKGSASRTAMAAAPSWRDRLLAWLSLPSAHAQGMPPATAGSPTSMVMSFHALLITANADCSGPYTEVQRFDRPREVDLVTNPTLFEGSPPAGTYRCVIFEADDILAISPDAAAQENSERCVVGNTYTTDLYRAPDTDFRQPNGTSIDAVGTRAAPGPQRVFFFATTDKTAATSRANGPSRNQTVTLASPLVVPTQTTLYVDATNGLLGGVEDGVPFCVVESGEMGFR